MFQSDDDDVAQSFRRPKLLKYSSHTTVSLAAAAAAGLNSLQNWIELLLLPPGRPAISILVAAGH